MKKIITICAFAGLFLIILFTSSCQKKETGFLTSGRKMVKINKNIITEDMVSMFSPAGMLDENQKREILEELIENFLVYDEAIKSDIMKDTMFLNQLELQRRLTIANKFIDERLQSIPLPAEEDLLAYYQIYKGKFDKQIKIAVVFFNPMLNKNHVDSLHNLIATGKKSFREIARDFSMDTLTGKKGGIIDRFYSFKEWTMAGFPVLDSIAFSLEKKGDVSNPFLTAQGTYMIIRIEDIIPSNRKYEELKQLILSLVYQEKKNTSLRSYLIKLRNESNVEYYDIQ